MRHRLFALLLVVALDGTAHAGCGPENASRQLPGPPPNGSETVAAIKAAKSGNYNEAMQLYKNIDAQGLAPALSLPANYPWRENIIFKQASDLAAARAGIGYFYEKGLGVPQDFSQAAKWYNKSYHDNYCGTTAVSPGAALNLGRLYAYGRGVPLDKSKAKAIWEGAGINSLARLLDGNGLPKTMEEWDRFDFKQAFAKLDAKNRTVRRSVSPSQTRAFGKPKRHTTARQQKVENKPQSGQDLPKPKPVVLPAFKFDL
jgi:hypothetical protein